MAKQDRSALRAGLFIVITLMLIAIVIVSIKGFRTVFTPVAEHKVHFTLADDIGGLRVGDDVRLGGFKVGVIHSIDVVGIAEGEKPGILITFSVPKKYPLYDNARVMVQGTLTGSSWLNIEKIGDGIPLAEDTELTGYPSVTTEMLAKLRDVAPEVTGLVKEVHAVTLPKVHANLDHAVTTIDSIHAFADRAAEMAIQVRDLFGDTNPDFRATVKHLNSVTASADEKLPGILDHLDGVMVKVGTTIDNAKSALEDIKATAVNLKDLSGNARGVIVNNRGKLDGIIASLKTTGDNLKGASAEVRRSPWRLLYKPAPDELENLTLYDAARQFSDGANDVNDAAMALRDATHNPQVDEAQLKKLVENLNATFANFHE
ncbi:MAG TPA: MlaD family protein, partial [Tepidisphaeraceae bacterium]|nr:MlaD family protein [Tepidisphaeraceae bacterium]